MFIKINKPGTNITNNNQGSSSNLVDYLSKENEDKAPGEKWENFFNQEDENIYKHKAVSIIDDLSKAGLRKDESKYFMFTINPSKNELEHLVDIASGHKKVKNNFVNNKLTYSITKNPKKTFDELNTQEQEHYKNMLKSYTNNVMDIYARNFNKDLTIKNINYVAKLENNREWNWRDKFVIENKNISKDILNLNKLKKNFNSNVSKDDLLQSINDTKSFINSREILKSNYSKEILKNNMAFLIEKIKIKEQLKLEPQNYELKKKDWDLDKKIIWTDDGKILTQKVLNANDKINKDLSLIENIKGKNAIKVIDKAIKLKQELKNKNKDGSVIVSGMKKEGLQHHIHVIVNRKTKEGVKISPLTNSRGHTQITKDGKDVKIGFSHDTFKVASQEAFSQKFGYKSNEKEIYIPKNISSRASSRLKNKALNQGVKLFGEEASQAVNKSRETISYTKSTIKIGKSLADLVISVGTGNPAQLTKSFLNVGKNVLKASSIKTKSTMRLELKSILTGRSLGK